MAAGSPRTRKNARERRSALIETTIALFAVKSYATVTTAEIAREAGISEALIYRHFKSKKALFLACFQEGIADYLLDRYRKLWGRYRKNPSEYLEAVGREYYRFVIEKPRRARLLALMLTAAYDPDIRAALKDFLEINVQAVARAYERIFAENPPAVPIQPRNAAWLFVGHYYTIVAVRELGFKERNEKSFMEMLRFELRP
ncbi:MAG: TetR/AcrR family transcriptional regulator [Deltaproteobacteria bacterium]|nr:TetR/AcrR family transcriptional regulator [Deltaproteobacteria bacterium]